MSAFTSLVKVDLLQTFNNRKLKENKAKTLSFGAVLLIGILIGLAFSTLYNLSLCKMIKSNDVNMIYATVLFAGFASMMSLTTSIFKLKGIIVGKDYQMLKSFPIKRHIIVASKLVSLYLVELLYTAIVMLPNLVITTIFSSNFTFIPLTLLLIVIIPFFPIVVGLIIALFISLVADRYRFGNIINVVLYTIMFAAIFYVSFSISYSGAQVDENGKLTITYFENLTKMAWLNPSLKLLQHEYLNKNYYFIFAFTGMNILALVVSVLFISLFYDSINTIGNSFHSNIKYERKQLQSVSKSKALFKSECGKLFKSKFYFLNCASTIICLVIFIVICIYILQTKVFDFNPKYKDIVREYGYLGSLIFMFSLGMATPSAVTISSEGQSFYLLKVLPITGKEIVKEKLRLSILFQLVPSVIVLVFSIIYLKLDIYAAVFLSLISITYIFVVNILGLILNLYYYKLNWKTEQEYCKNSSSVVLGLLIDFGLMITTCGLFCLSLINKYLGSILPFALLFICFVIFYKILFSIADKRISEIE